MHMTLICILKHLQIQLKQVANIEYTFTTDFCLQYCVGLCGRLTVSLILQVQPSGHTNMNSCFSSLHWLYQHAGGRAVIIHYSLST